MTEAEFLLKKEGLSSSDRLVCAVLDCWSGRRDVALSVRSLAHAASVPVSSIYHHFGGLEHLYEAAQEQARAGAEHWCAAQLDVVPGTYELSPAAFPAWLAALIDDWSSNHRHLAFAWGECQRLAAQDVRYLPALDAWRALWASFWRTVCDRCGLGARGEITSLLFDGESVLHLMQWRRTVDRTCLEEFCAGWASWLDGRLASEGPWRRFARTEAMRLMPALPMRGGVAERIAVAAAETVERRGMAGLTHRAVAAQADVTLGLVSYNFRTSADLARAAFEMIYRRVVPTSAQDEPEPIGSAEEAIERAVGYHKASTSLLALEELLIGAGRDASLAAFRPQLRYLRGRTSGGLLRALLGKERSISPLDAALFSAFGTGRRRACVGKTPDEIESFVRSGLNDIRILLGKE